MANDYTEYLFLAEHSEELKQKEEEYKKYLANHIAGVKEAYEKYGMEMIKCLFPADEPSVIDDLYTTIKYTIIEKHDSSKYENLEFSIYRQKFYPIEGEPKVDNDEFIMAWLHHIHNNPHHLEHWIAYVDCASNLSQSTKILVDMPNEYIIEMMCDWLSMEANGNDSVEDYYNNNKSSIMDKATVLTIAKIEIILESISKIKQEHIQSNNPSLDYDMTS